MKNQSRHGDFAPWHLIKLNTNQLALIDGEHARSNGVEYYDIAYFIQRVFSVLGNQLLSKQILSLLLKRNYNLQKLKVILASRAIGGFLDESLKSRPNYQIANQFKSWALNITTL